MILIHKNQLLSIITLWLCFYAITAASLPEDSQQPINIQADSATQNTTETGTDKITYTGNVQMTQGSLIIKGDKIVVFSKERKVMSLMATGQPAHFQQQSSPDKPSAKASANNIEYILIQDSVTLFEKAELDQNGSVIRGEKINYNIATESVEAKGGNAADENSRVIMILEPDQLEQEKNAPEPVSTEDTNLENTDLKDTDLRDNESPAAEKDTPQQP